MFYGMYKLVQEAVIYDVYTEKYRSVKETRLTRIAFEIADSLVRTDLQHERWDQCRRYVIHV